MMMQFDMRLRVQPAPLRLRVLKALTRAIERVTPDNGYHHDLRGKVFRGRVRFDRNDPIPMVTIIEAPIPPETTQVKGSNTVSHGPWELLLQGFAEDDIRNPSDPAHYLMAEVKAVLAAEKLNTYGHDILGMSNKVTNMTIGQGTVRPPEDPTVDAFFWLTLTLNIVEDLHDPYS